MIVGMVLGVIVRLLGGRKLMICAISGTVVSLLTCHLLKTPGRPLKHTLDNFLTGIMRVLGS